MDVLGCAGYLDLASLHKRHALHGDSACSHHAARSIEGLKMGNSIRADDVFRHRNVLQYVVNVVSERRIYNACEKQKEHDARARYGPWTWRWILFNWWHLSQSSFS